MNPNPWSRSRIRLLWDSREVRTVVIGFAVALAAAGWMYYRGSATEQPTSVSVGVSGQPTLDDSRPTSPTRGSPAAAMPLSASRSATSIVIDVVGPVRHPGNVTIPAGSRVSDAIAAAGGLSVRRVSINLARILTDGEQIDVGVAGDSGSSGNGSPGGSGAKAGSGIGSTKINLNTARPEQLEQLPRIGPATAAKIIDFRSQHGGFRTVEQLQEVPGIGDRTFAQLKPLVTV